MRVVKITLISLILFCCCYPATVKLQEKDKGKPARSNSDTRVKALDIANSRATSAAQAMREIMKSSSTKIPDYIMSQAEVIAVFSSRPSFGPAKDDGVGLASARDPKTKEWRAPIYVTFKGGHIEGQLEDTKLDNLFNIKEGELILLGMNQRAVPYFFNPEFELGSDCVVLAGSFGNIANPGDEVAAVSSGFLAYYHSKGVIAGVSVAGSVIRQDEEMNDAVYEERRLTTFLERQKFISPSVLAFPLALDEVAKK